ncbi:MAG: 3-deoxy-D-manno-octulosonate 8-phosphate phosphatase [Limnohabitans sp.]|nr:3-deoxy-D-manno-octulosonate 8-phosphate phosphatase [Limnohabitans sp.]
MTYHTRFTQDLLERAKDTRILFLDVDGVLTDGSIYLTEHGEAIKKFHTLDGLGIKQLQQVGIAVVIISGRESTPLKKRIAELSIQHFYLNVENKLTRAQAVLDGLQLDWSQAACMGDDWPDAPVLKKCNLAISPPLAHYEITKIAHYTTQNLAGHGAVREMCDMLLVASGHYDRLWKDALW